MCNWKTNSNCLIYDLCKMARNLLSPSRSRGGQTMSWMVGVTIHLLPLLIKLWQKGDCERVALVPGHMSKNVPAYSISFYVNARKCDKKAGISAAHTTHSTHTFRWQIGWKFHFKTRSQIERFVGDWTLLMKLDTNIAQEIRQIRLRYRYTNPKLCKSRTKRDTATAYAKCLTLNWPIRRTDCLSLRYCWHR